MPQAQPRSEPIACLDTTRAEIDRIDDALLDLVERRLAAAAAVAASKVATADGRLKLRPRREAEIIARLSDQARLASPELVSHIWRCLMSHSLQRQSRTEFVLAAAAGGPLADLVRDRFGPASPIRHVDGVAAALTAAREAEAVAIVAPGDLPPLGDDLRIFDQLTGADGKPIAVAIGRVAEEDALPIVNR